MSNGTDVVGSPDQNWTYTGALLLCRMFVIITEVCYCLNRRKMLTKGKKPEPKEEAKDPPQVAAPVRQETPKLLRAALEMTEKSSGLKGALAKVKEKTSKSSVSLQVNTHLNKPKTKHNAHSVMTRKRVFSSLLFQPSISSSLPPPSPTSSSGPDRDVDTPSPVSTSSAPFRSASASQCHGDTDERLDVDQREEGVSEVEGNEGGKRKGKKSWWLFTQEQGKEEIIKWEMDDNHKEERGNREWSKGNYGFALKGKCVGYRGIY